MDLNSITFLGCEDLNFSRASHIPLPLVFHLYGQVFHNEESSYPVMPGWSLGGRLP